jgi:subtilisin family serine protease
MLAVIPASAAANSDTRIIVKRESGLSSAERRDIRADAGVRYVESLSLPRTEVVAAAPGDVGDAVRDLNADPDVVHAQPARPRHATADPGLSQQWGLRNTGQHIQFYGAGTNDADMDVTEAWGLSTGAGQTVAVVDTGINRTHPDLAGQVFGGYDFLDDDSDPADPDGHGTHVAGTIAAARDNGIGVAGVAPDSILVPLRALGPGATDIETAEAFDWAGDHGVRIVNASLSGEQASVAEYDAMAEHPETLYVVAAGNDNDDVDNAGSAYPCAYDLENVVCVGASDSNDAPASFSNYGTTSVDLFAPGVGILSTEDTGYFFKDGTSMATPHVTGAAALVLARNPAQDAAAMKAALLDHGDDVPALAPKSFTGRRANANASLLSVTEDAGEAPPFISDIDGDGFADASDNCVEHANDQADGNGNDVGDACDDRDSDGKVDASDNCVDVANGGQADKDQDGEGDACDSDIDADGVLNDAPDNCVSTSNANQADADGDGTGDACDSTPRGIDSDGDGKPALDDTCPNQYGTLPNGCAPETPAPAPPANSDGDDRIDGSDACPLEYAISNDGCPLAQVSSLSAKVRKRSATVKVAATRAATLTITVQRKKGRRWVRVTRRTVSGTGSTLRVSRLRRGSHRVRVSISSGAGAGTPVSKSFRVR